MPALVRIIANSTPRMVSPVIEVKNSFLMRMRNPWLQLLKLVQFIHLHCLATTPAYQDGRRRTNVARRRQPARNNPEIILLCPLVLRTGWIRKRQSRLRERLVFTRGLEMQVYVIGQQIDRNDIIHADFHHLIVRYDFYVFFFSWDFQILYGLENVVPNLLFRAVVHD